MASALLLLLLPVLALARMKVDIFAVYKDGKLDVAVHRSGEDVQVVTDKELELFGLGGSRLKEVVKRFYGEQPTDVYVRSPTPWEDVYKTHGWSQVFRTLNISDRQILNITTELQNVTKTIENNSSKPKTFNVGISEDIKNTVASSWPKAAEMFIGQRDIQVDFTIQVMGTEYSSFSVILHSSWGKITEKSHPVTIRGSSVMELLLQPAQSVLAQLQAIKSSIRIELEYRASLSGNLVVNFENQYKGHHFWSLDLISVMPVVHLSKYYYFKQIVDIDLYFDSNYFLDFSTSM